MTPYAALLDRVAHAPSTPLVTYVDPASAERMELSAASFANAVAKTAGLLRDELDAEPGDRIAVHLPWHWQRAVWFGACAATQTVFAPGADPGGCAVCVMDRDGMALAGRASWDALVSLAPFGLPDGEAVAPGIVEVAVAMRAHPDAFVPYAPLEPDAPLLVHGDEQLSARQVWDRAARLAGVRHLDRGARYAVLPDDPERDLLLITSALAIEGSVVLIASDGDGVRPLLDAEGATLTGDPHLGTRE